MEQDPQEYSSKTMEPKLPFGDINVLVVTDVHSWVAGHGVKEPNSDANYGDVVSFYERLKEHCSSKGMDLWFVMNGDWIDGTGLAMDGDPSHLIPILEKMPWDAINIGNHDLYLPEVVEYMARPAGLVEWFGERFLSSNQRFTNNEPIGNPSRILHGESGRVLTFGFLYNMYDCAETVNVERVENVINEEWFVDTLQKDDFDAILVLAHMDVKDNLIGVILGKIREIVGEEMPVQFITGHTHYRGQFYPDTRSSSMEAGRYLDTVGFVSFPSRATLSSLNTSESRASDLFQHVFLDASVAALEETLGVEELRTPDGEALSDFIYDTRYELGLENNVSCVPRTYKFSSSLEAPDSLWGLYQSQIVPYNFRNNEVLMNDNGNLRYNLFEGEVRVDDIIALSPFNDSLYMLPQVESEAIVQLNASLNHRSKGSVPDYIMTYSGDFQPENSHYDLIMNSYKMQTIMSSLAKYTTVPDAVALNQTYTGLWFEYFEHNNPCQSLYVREILTYDSTETVPTYSTSGNLYVFVAVVGIFAAIAFVSRGVLRKMSASLSSWEACPNEVVPLGALDTTSKEEVLEDIKLDHHFDADFRNENRKSASKRPLQQELDSDDSLTTPLLSVRTV